MAAKKATKKAVEESALTVVETVDREITQLDAAEVVADDNLRHSLKRGRIESLKEEIIRDGGITAPVEVEPLTEEEMGKKEYKGKMYRVTFGHYRHAAVTEANKEGYSFTLPAMVVEIGDPVKRLRRQLAENLVREDLSPIDKGVAMKRLLDSGVPKLEVRQIFATPGGRKGLKSQLASNSFVNMTLSFLDLSKKVQDLIHNGEIGVADAYFLTKQPADKQELYVEKAIQARLKELESEEADENKFLEAERKAAEAEAKAKELSGAVEAAEKEVEAGIQELKDKAAAASKLYLEKAEITEIEARKAAEAAHKAAEKEAQEAEKALAAKRKELDKQKEKAEKLDKAAQERADKLKAARETAVSAAGGKKSADDKPVALKVKASAATQVKNTPNKDGISLTHTAILKVVKDLSLTGSYKKVTLIGRAIGECFSGRIDDKELFHRLAVITGEKAEKPTKAA